MTAVFWGKVHALNIRGYRDIPSSFCRPLVSCAAAREVQRLIPEGGEEGGSTPTNISYRGTFRPSGYNFRGPLSKQGVRFHIFDKQVRPRKSSTPPLPLNHNISADFGMLSLRCVKHKVMYRVLFSKHSIFQLIPRTSLPSPLPHPFHYWTLTRKERDLSLSTFARATRHSIWTFPSFNFSPNSSPPSPSCPPRLQSPAVSDFGPSPPKARNLWNPG